MEEPEFKWGKKRGVGGKKRDVQFYESFTYDGKDYSLYDDVYMYKEGVPDPYIGKLVKIWENGDKTKKLKIHWFFRPTEILYYLGDMKVLDKEIFFASGAGTGLANLNPPEAIDGKCNVVCISKDSRNPQPSAEELQVADYVFYRTFDVKNCTFSDQMDDTVGGLDVTFVFNRKKSDRTLEFHKLDPHVKDNERIAVACNETPKREGNNSPQYMKNMKPDERSNHIREKEYTNEKEGQVKHGSSHGEGKNVSLNKESAPRGKYTLADNVNSDDDREVIGSGKPANQVQVENVGKFMRKSISLDDAPSKRAKFDGTSASSKVNDSNGVQSLRIPENSAKQVVTTNLQSNSDLVKNCVGLEKDEKFAKNSSSSMKRPFKMGADLSKEKANIGDDAHHDIKKAKLSKDSLDVDGGCTKKAKFDSSIKKMEDNNKNTLKKLKKIGESETKKLGANETKKIVANETKKIGANETKKIPTFGTSDGGETKSRSGNAPSKEHHNMKTDTFSKDLPKLSALTPKGDDKKVKGQIFEVTPRPLVEKVQWIKLSWPEKMKRAHDQGTLVLLQNLDPEYTSGEIEDIIWHAFNEQCTAKMVQHTATSSPHSGKAFVIFKTRDAAERVLQKLDAECLMLPNHRPLVGCTGVFQKSEKQTKFFGHLDIDRSRHQIQRELKEAVSTSHYSQSNTIEYEMAMGWCLLQSKSDKWWESLYEKQRKDLRRLTADLKPK